MVVVFWYFCILFYLYFVPFVLCCNCILLHLYFGNLYSVLLYFVVFVFWNFVFCSICILSHLYFVAFAFCYICILAICILFFCILSCLYFGIFVFCHVVFCFVWLYFILFVLWNICILTDYRSKLLKLLLLHQRKERAKKNQKLGRTFSINFQSRILKIR